MAFAEEEEIDRSSLGELVDPNIKIIPGKNYDSGVEALDLDQRWKCKKNLTIGDVKEMWKCSKTQRSKIRAEENDKDGASAPKRLYLNEILTQSKVIIPTLEIPKRNPELEKRLEVLRRKLDEKEYQRMTKNINLQHQQQPEDSIRYQLKQMNSGIIAVVQFLISLAAAFFFGFRGIELFTGPLELEVRLLLGIACAVIVGIADLYVLVTMLDNSLK